MRADLPTGTVTFLFTDVEGSTQLLEGLGAERYGELLAEHHRVCREIWAAPRWHRSGLPFEWGSTRVTCYSAKPGTWG